MTLYILGRIIFGAYFLYSGFNHFKNEKMLTGYTKSKGVPAPMIAVTISGILLTLGGLGFLTGVYIYASSILLLIFLIPVTFIMHAFWKTTDPMQKMGDQINFTKNLALVAALLMLM